MALWQALTARPAELYRAGRDERFESEIKDKARK
jgi:hypothetical protein